jgi:hypothetical protein
MTTTMGLNPTTDLYPLRDTIRCAAAAHHAEDNARGREAVEQDPTNPNHTRAAAAWRIQIRRERIAEDTADLAARLVHHTSGQTRGVRWTVRLMERVAETGREVAYWEGVHCAARR